MLLPSGYHLKEVTARLQWMGQMGKRRRDRRRGSYPCRQLRDKGQGPGIKDQGSGTWQSQQVGKHLNQASRTGPPRGFPWRKVWVDGPKS